MEHRQRDKIKFYLSRPRLMQIRLYLSPLLHFQYKVTLAETEKALILMLRQKLLKQTLAPSRK